MRTLIALLGVCAGAAPLDVGGRRQLFLDERFVLQPRGVEFVVHQPRKTGEVSIPSDEAWPLGGYHSMLYEAGVYHMWYTARTSICYARSFDGIHWERPRLGLTAINGSTANNVVIGYGAGGVKGGTHGVMVFLDPKAPREERFRLAANPPEFKRMLQLFSSPDGIHWKHSHRDILVYDENRKPHHLDTLNVIFFDDRLGKYVAYVRRSTLERGRGVGRAESDTLRFGAIEQNVRPVFDGEAFPVRRGGKLLVDVYTNNALKYPWAQDAYFLFPAMYYHYGPHLAEFRNESPTNAGVLDARFAAGRDGIVWNTYDGRPFVPVGVQGEFDARRIYMVYGLAPSLDGREMYMYYLGTNDTHGWERDDRNNRLLTAAGVAPQPLRRAISRVTLRRDGFVSLRAGRAAGEFVTPPLRMEGKQLVLNVDTSALGEVQVEIQDESGAPLAGFSLAESDIIHSANDINRTVTWKGSSDVSALAGKPIRLRFLLHDADLYAFQFRERPSI
ncbi:MAG: hypothetical protein ACE15B_20045 [Bryobacteraceae bacterium]